MVKGSLEQGGVMTNEKEFGFAEEGSPERESAPRARNRTVMLSPEMTGAVRARIAQGLGHTAQNQPGHVPTDQLGPLVNRVAPSQQPLNQGVSQHSQSIHGGYHPDALDLPYQGGAPVANQMPNSHSGFHQADPHHMAESFTRYQRITPIIGFLVSYDAKPEGEVFELRSGRLIITSDRSTPGSIMFVSDPTVSPSHAILRITAEGDIQVLDQLSEFGTRVECQGTGEALELSGDKSAVGHGDILQLGERRFHVCLVAKGSDE